MTKTIADEQRKARKLHRCHMCFRHIEPGETYRHQRNVDGGTAWTWKCCAHCDAAIHILDLWQGWHCGDEGLTHVDFEEFEPQTVAQARIKVGWRRRWRRKDGTLREVPTKAVSREP
jgi:hypothetical protein